MQSPVQFQQPRTIYYQKSTNNKSFLDMHFFLKSMGIQNNKFMLVLFDPDLAGIDPHDVRLNAYMKQKVLRECLCNYWYFIREVVRIPDQGGTGMRFELHRGNLALNFCMELNLNVFLELPRQQFKTVSAIIRYLYLFNFGTTNSIIAFLNKEHSASKENLATLKTIRDALPSYLKLNQDFSQDGKKIKTPDTVETLQHKINGNRIRTFPSAKSKQLAVSVLRGKTIPLTWFDEYGFMPFNDTVYLNGVPALQTAWINAKRNNAPYGILITTTPGFMATDSGVEAYNKKENATMFNEAWYDMTYQEIMTIVDANTKSTFVYIRYSYQQLGRDEKWFANICKTMEFKWEDIRREVLLEWSQTTTNSPFTQEDLEKVSQLVKDPIKQIYFLGKYVFNIYEEIELRNGVPRFPPLIGVDVSGGFNKDSSAITCVCSCTTKVFADLNCNYISTPELASVVYELVTKFMPNAIVNVERNGGYGASVLSKLIPSRIKSNLFYEIKDRVIEERNDGIRIIRTTQKTKVYGLDSTKSIRELLMQILRERMEYHKDKFISRIIYKELLGLETKRSGRIEHSSNSHDDQIFSYLMALYIWYEGKDLAERYGIQKTTIKTDEDLDEAVPTLSEKLDCIIEELRIDGHDQVKDEISDSLKDIKKQAGTLYHDWMKKEIDEDNRALNELLMTRHGKIAFSKQYNVSMEDIEQECQQVTIPDSVFIDFYTDEEDRNK